MCNILNITLAQLNWLVGDIEGNCKQMLKHINQQENNTDILLFSELALTGYPPEDLLFRKDFYQQCTEQLNNLQNASNKIAIVVGHPWKDNGKYYNALSVFWKKQVLTRYYKQYLPNYGVFDEKRYFYPGNKTCVLDFKGHKLGFLICEDIWFNEPVNAVKTYGAEILITINASPYNIKKPNIRTKLLQSHSTRIQIPIIYLNQVGGQDELVFDGGSKIFNNQGLEIVSLQQFNEQVIQYKFNKNNQNLINHSKYTLSSHAQVYNALVMATHDYIYKNKIPGVILGLSGGIDSALTLAIAVDALGNKNIQAVMMPFKYTRKNSIIDAKKQAKLLNVELLIISINDIYQSLINNLSLIWDNKNLNSHSINTNNNLNIAQENLQARCRNIILMALSNKNGYLVLSTTNKSEYAIGYTTIYGDMAGGFAVLKDISKTLVFELSKYRNLKSLAIPEEIINKLPSSELTAFQFDKDVLPEYKVLDAIIENYIETDNSINELIKKGFDEIIIKQIIELINNNEYKRRQAPIGPRISIKNFGKDRRYPITSGFKP